MAMMLSAWTNAPGWQTTLQELRAVLFFELRRWRHFGDDPDALAMAKFDWLLESIRQKVPERKR